MTGCARLPLSRVWHSIGPNKRKVRWLRLMIIAAVVDSMLFAHRIHNFCCCCGPQCIIIALEGLYGLSLYNNVTVNNWQRGFRILNSAKIQSETVKWLIQNSYVAWMLSASHLLFVGFSIHFVSSISQVNKKKRKGEQAAKKNISK